MKETTRQLVLLIGILVFLTSSLIVINHSRASNPEQPDKPDLNQTNLSEKDDNLEKSAENQSVIAQSIRGYKMMYKDISIAFNDLLGLGDSSDGS